MPAQYHSTRQSPGGHLLARGQAPVLAGTPLAIAESHGEFTNLPASHIDHWAGLQRDSSVPPDMQYEVPPRGRVVYETRAQQFTLFATGASSGAAAGRQNPEPAMRAEGHEGAYGQPLQMRKMHGEEGDP